MLPRRRAQSPAPRLVTPGMHRRCSRTLRCSSTRSGTPHSHTACQAGAGSPRAPSDLLDIHIRIVVHVSDPVCQVVGFSLVLHDRDEHTIGPGALDQGLVVAAGPYRVPNAST